MQSARLPNPPGATAMSRRVFSYARFSHSSQRNKTSLARQKEGENWVIENGYELVETFVDRAKSAYKGRHLEKTGKLKKIIELIEIGIIASGDILMVECLDRIDRREPSDALTLFFKILNSGVDIQVFLPEKKLYTKESVKNIQDLMMVVLAYCLSYDESKKKGIRVASAWKQKRKLAREGKTIQNFKPAWLTQDNKKIPAKVKCIQFIFEKFVEGWTINKIKRELDKKGVTVGRSKSWNTTYIARILESKSVIGIYIPRVLINDVWTNETEIPDYFPAIIDETLWTKARNRRFSTKEPKGKPTDRNLFTGLLHCANDDEPMYVKVSTSRGKKITYLSSYGIQQKKENSCRININYEMFETQVLHFITDTLNTPKREITNDTKTLESQLLQLHERIQQIEIDIEDTSKDYDSLRIIYKKLVDKKKDIEKELNRESVPIGKIQKSITALLSSLKSGDNENRAKVKQLIASIVDSIYVMPEKHGKNIFVLFQINYKDGSMRQCGYFREQVLYLAMLQKITSKDCDIREKKNITGAFFARFLKKINLRNGYEVNVV